MTLDALPPGKDMTRILDQITPLNESPGTTDAQQMELQSRTVARKDVEAILDHLRPGLVADGGNLELIDIEPDGTVRVVFQGACANCPAQTTTLRVAIQEPLRSALPGISSVIAI
jgi:Fe-S cluster biogenesis protein NfuA